MIDGGGHSKLVEPITCDLARFRDRSAESPWLLSPCIQLWTSGQVSVTRPRKHRQGRVDDNMFGSYDVDGVRERVAGEIGVEQRNDSADARYPQPDRHVFWTIWHEQTDDVAGRETLSQRPTRILIGSLRERAIGQAFPLGKKSGRRPNLSARVSMRTGNVTEVFLAMGAVISSARTHALSGELGVSSESIVTLQPEMQI